MGGLHPGGAIETVEGALMSNFFAAVKGDARPSTRPSTDMQKAANDALAAHK